MCAETWLWIVFAVAVPAMLAVDLAVHRGARAVKLTEAVAWSAVWSGLSLGFLAVVSLWRGPEDAVEFLTGYLVEWSLSVDNLFVFLVVFSYFRVPAAYQHKVLFWGILGAVVMRAALIAGGLFLIQLVDWIVYVFGAFLIFTGLRLAVREEPGATPERNPVLRLARRFLPLTTDYVEDRLFVRRGAKRLATPLFVVLLVIETTDVIFAVDSVPAVLAITSDPFIVYTSNVFAILGLRALYFTLAGVLPLFRYLRYGLAVILVFVGVKMTFAHVLEIPAAIALGVVALTLAGSVLTSLMSSRRERRARPSWDTAPAGPGDPPADRSIVKPQGPEA
jgi:tellurite resistance protein TerC